MRAKITKCYLVQVVDDEGKELACEYVFGGKKQAKDTGELLICDLIFEQITESFKAKKEDAN